MLIEKPLPDKPQRRTDGIAREAERREITGVPLSTWHVLQNQGRAPKPVRLGPRSVGWLRGELLAWVEDRVAERDDSWQKLGTAAQRVIGKLGRP
jgi:prophage regulatory protein